MYAIPELSTGIAKRTPHSVACPVGCVSITNKYSFTP